MTTLRLPAICRPSLAHGGLSEPTAPVMTQQIGVAVALCTGIVVGMGLGNGPVTMAAAVAALLAAVISPPTGLLVLAFMAALRSPLVIPAPGFNTLLVGAILLGSIYRLPIDRPRLRPALPLLLLLAFTIFAGLQQLPDLVAGYPGAESRRIGYLFIQLATLTAIAFAAAHVLRGRDPTPFVVAGVLGAAFAGLLAILVYVLPPGSVINLVDRPDATARVVGPFGDPNYFGLFQATAIAACLAALTITARRRWRVLFAATSIVLFLAFAIALSRGALVALGAGVVAVAFTRGRWTGAATIATLAIVVLILYPLFLEWRVTADAGRLSAQAYVTLERSDASRIAAALAGPQLFVTAPVFGIGFGQYPLLSGRVIGYPIESHNWYMNVLAEQGLVGVFLWVPLMGALALRLFRLPNTPRSVGLAVFATYATGSIFLQPPLSVQTSAFAVLVVAAALAADWRGPVIAGRWRARADASQRSADMHADTVKAPT